MEYWLKRSFRDCNCNGGVWKVGGKKTMQRFIFQLPIQPICSSFSSVASIFQEKWKSLFSSHYYTFVDFSQIFSFLNNWFDSLQHIQNNASIVIGIFIIEIIQSIQAFPIYYEVLTSSNNELWVCDYYFYAFRVPEIISYWSYNKNWCKLKSIYHLDLIV